MQCAAVAVCVIHNARSDRDIRDFTLDTFLGGIEGCRRNVYRHVDNGLLARHGSLQKQAGLVRRACAQLDDAETGACCRLRNHRVSMSGEYRPLCTREVVLGTAGDFVEESRAGLVIKKPGRQVTWTRREAVTDCRGNFLVHRQFTYPVC